MKAELVMHTPKPLHKPEAYERIEYRTDEGNLFATGSLTQWGNVQISWIFQTVEGNVGFHGCTVGKNAEESFEISANNIEIGLNKAIDEWEAATGRSFKRTPNCEL